SADQLAVVAGDLDLVHALQAPELDVDRIARPHVVRVVVPRAQEPADERSGHVSRPDEADLLHEPSPPPETPGRLTPGPRAPKSAPPSRIKVAPSSTAIEKSLLIPIDRWGSSTPRRASARSRSSRSMRKKGRESPELRGAGGTVIRPSSARLGWRITSPAR